VTRQKVLVNFGDIIRVKSLSKMYTSPFTFIGAVILYDVK